MAVATLDKQEVERLARQFEAAFKRGDFASLASFYAEDAKMMPPDTEVVQGRQAIQQFWQAMPEQLGVKEFTLKVQEVEASGDIAYEVGTADLQIEAAGGQAITITIKYVVVWKRQADGAWRLAVDIFNRNSPA